MQDRQESRLLNQWRHQQANQVVNHPDNQLPSQVRNRQRDRRVNRRISKAVFLVSYRQESLLLSLWRRRQANQAVHPLGNQRTSQVLNCQQHRRVNRRISQVVFLVQDHQ